MTTSLFCLILSGAVLLYTRELLFLAGFVRLSDCSSCTCSMSFFVLMTEFFYLYYPLRLLSFFLSVSNLLCTGELLLLSGFSLFLLSLANVFLLHTCEWVVLLLRPRVPVFRIPTMSCVLVRCLSSVYQGNCFSFRTMKAYFPKSFNVLCTYSVVPSFSVLVNDLFYLYYPEYLFSFFLPMAL